MTVEILHSTMFAEVRYPLRPLNLNGTLDSPSAKLPPRSVIDVRERETMSSEL